MLAKCSRCAQTFQTDRFGTQFCPFCGAQVMIADPSAQPLAAAATPQTGGPIPPPQATPPGAQDQDAPIDVPAAHGGWFGAAVETWKRSLFDPMNFFSRIKPTPMGGALGYGVALSVVGGIFAGMMQLVQGALQKDQFRQMEESLQALPPEVRHAMEGGIKFLMPSVTGIFTTPILTVVGLFLNALLLHLALMIVGGNKSGLTATLRALALAQGPVVFNVVPFCGGVVGSIWVLVLNIIGLAGLHRISIGRAIGAYVVVLVGLCCFCCVPAVGGIAMLIKSAAGAMPAGGFDAP